MTIHHHDLTHLSRSKPSVGDLPTVTSTVNALLAKRKLIQDKMRGITQRLRASDDIDTNLLDEWSHLNAELYHVKIKEAALVYLRNML